MAYINLDDGEVIVQDSQKQDAGETIFLARDLQHKLATSRDVKFRNLKALTLIPINSEAGNAARTISWDSYTEYGMASFLTSYRAGDFPSVDVSRVENIIKIRSIGDKFSYNFQELREAAMAKVPLTDKRRVAAVRAIDTKLDRVAWFGDADRNIPGLVNYPGTTESTLLADGTGASKLWATKTPEQILRDVTQLVSAIKTPTNDVEFGDTLLLPSSIYTAIGGRVMDPANGSNVTILTFLKTNLAELGIKTIAAIPELNGAGAGATNRVMLYRNDPMNLEFHLPVPMEFLPVSEDGGQYDVKLHSRVAGLTVYYVLSVAWADGL